MLAEASSALRIFRLAYSPQITKQFALHRSTCWLQTPKPPGGREVNDISGHAEYPAPESAELQQAPEAEAEAARPNSAILSINAGIAEPER
jgi:hypothetical protein